MKRLRITEFHYLIVILLWLAPLRLLAADQLAYYSDYFSFIGRDDRGFVAFALDTNRGVDGSEYQAEHFGVLYDERSGWVELVGTGEYENVHNELKPIPDSPSFKFKGRPLDGLTIISIDNHMTLTIEPLAVQLRDKSQNRSQSWSAAAALLEWNGRRIYGRVIGEHLVYRHWNRLTRTYTGTWNNFQGFYIVIDPGTTAQWKDLYLRSEEKGDQRSSKGFSTAVEWSGAIEAKRFSAFDKVLNWGFFRWPRQWDMELQVIDAADSAPARLKLHHISRVNKGNWIIGGFSMTVAKGELIVNGLHLNVLALVELIK